MPSNLPVVFCIIALVAIVATAEKNGKTSMLRQADSFSDIVDELNDYENNRSFHRLLAKILRYLPSKRAAAAAGESARKKAQKTSDEQEKADKKPAGVGVKPASNKGPGLVGCTKSTLKTFLTKIHKAADSTFTGSKVTVSDSAKHISVDYHFDSDGRPSYAEVTFQKDWKKCDSKHRDAKFQSKFTDYFVKSGFTNSKMTGTGTKKEHPQINVGGYPIEAGHIVGAQFCGPNNILNFVPQSKASNIGAWATGETNLANFLESAKGKQCEVKAKMSYTYGTTGPSSVTHADPENTAAPSVNECLKMLWPSNLKLELISITKKGTDDCPDLPKKKVLANTSHQTLRLLDLINELQSENSDLESEVQPNEEYDEDDLERELESLIY